MKERPILFSAPMVRALLDGSKTQTRRVVKPQPSKGWDFEAPPVFGRITSPHPKKGRFGVFIRHGVGTDFPMVDLIPCPYGQPGDRLWVRETWAHYHTVNHIRRSDGRAFDEVSDGLAGYRADGCETIEEFREHVRLMSGCDLQAVEINGDRWRPSIHMPRWASRITLEVTGVRVERLGDVSESDARAEGVQSVAEFKELWASINGPSSWDANPFVWVVSFRRMSDAR